MYEIVLSEKAIADILRLRKSEPVAYTTTGTGHPEPLKGNRTGQWSRMITKKHRLVYEIVEQEVHVNVLSSYGHYDDK